MTKYIVKDKKRYVHHYWSYWKCGLSRRLTERKEEACKFTADELKSNTYVSRLLLDKKRYVLIPVKE